MKRLTFAIITLALVALVLEFAAAKLEPLSRSLRGPYQPWDITGPIGFPPNLAYDNAGTTTHINEGGYRGAFRPPVRTPHTTRIAVLGDSMTFGWGMPDDATPWPAQLETLLNERAATLCPQSTPPPTFEVLNFGHPGYNTHLESLLYTRRVRDYRPDAVLLAYYGNDAQIDRYTPLVYDHCPVPMPTHEKLIGKAIARSAFLRITHDLITLALLGYPGMLEGHILITKPDYLGFRCSMHYLAELRDAVAADRARLAVIQIPYLPERALSDDPERIVQDRLAAAFAKPTRETDRTQPIEPIAPIPSLNLYPHVPPEAHAWVIPDTHPDARGHTLFARIIADHITTLDLNLCPTPHAPAKNAYP